MQRAFLSHASVDKDFVEAVANHLHRARVIYDQHSFVAGKRLAEQIIEGLAQSSIFVLFASRQALSRHWVQFEITEAEQLMLGKKLSSVLVILMDPSIGVDELPEWMREVLAARKSRANAIARLILARLIESTLSRQRELFFGRELLLDDISERLVPSTGERPPQVLIFSGLPGVGRRTLASRTVKDKLLLEIGPILLLPEHAGLDLLYLKLLEETKGIEHRRELAELIAAFNSFTVEERAVAVTQELAVLARETTAAFVIFETAILDDRGRFPPDLQILFAKIGEVKPDIYLVIVQNRRPAIGQSQMGATRVAEIAVPPIDAAATRKLIIQRSRYAGLDFSDGSISALIPFVEGFPSAVDFALEYAKRYGVQALLLNTHMLVDIKHRAFSELLKSIVTEELGKNILRLAAIGTGLTLPDLELLTGVPQDNVVGQLTYLIDCNLIVVIGDRYVVPVPLRDSVFRSFGLISGDEYAAIASKLRTAFWTNNNALPSLDIVDLTIISAARGNSPIKDEFADIIIPSQLIRVAISAYHAKDYRMANEYAERVAHTGHATDELWSIYVRTKTRLAYEGVISWLEAEECVEEARRRGIRKYPYLKGFLFWKKGDLQEAIRWFERAEESGDKRPSVFRDRAHCHFASGDYRAAERDISGALDKYPEDNFITDLAARIYIKSRRFDKAAEMLSILERVEPVKENVSHRRAIFLAEKGEFEEALKNASQAATRNPPLHEILATEADILIELGRYDEAIEKLGSIEANFKSPKLRNVNAGLRCKLSNKKGDWRSAEVHFANISDPQSPVHKKLKHDILKLKIADSSLAQRARADAQAELEALMPKIRELGAEYAQMIDTEVGAPDSYE